MNAVTGTAARGREAGERMTPSGGAGVSAPPPDTNTAMTCPGDAGFFAEFSEKSSLNTEGAMKPVEVAPNTAGVAVVTATCVVATGTPPMSTSTEAVAPANSSGMMATTWLAETDNNGAGYPPTRSCTPP